MGPCKRVRTSELWNHFSIKDAENKIATCDFCGQCLNYRATVTNLKKHIERRHPTIFCQLYANVNKKNQIQDFESPSTSTACVTTETRVLPVVENEKSSLPKVQSDLNNFLPSSKYINATQQKKLDRLLLQLFIHDFQPFSIVEDEGFVNFVKGLNPSYKLPNRKTITNVMVTSEYEKCLNAVHHELVDIDSVCLTTDTWTSMTVQSYLCVTAHYITDNFELRSILLECSFMPFSHTSSNLGDQIHCILEKFHLTDKISLIVTDNAYNITGAVTKQLQENHFPCFAHTLNLILQDALKKAKELIDKIKNIVSFFKRSSSGLEKLYYVQKNNLGLEPKKNSSKKFPQGRIRLSI